MPTEEALTEDEKALLRLVERYRWAERSGRKALRDAAIAHYRKAKEEATHGEQARIEAEIRALAPRGLYRNVLDLAKQIGRRMSGCMVRAAPEAANIALETNWDDSADDAAETAQWDEDPLAHHEQGWQDAGDR